MRTFILFIGLLIAGLSAIHAQDTEKRKDDFDELVIRKKGDKNSKVTIEIRDDEVIVNGKSLDDFEDEGLTIRKRKMPRFNPMEQSPRFRELYMFPGGKGWEPNESSEGEMPGQKKALLGVSMENVKEGARVTEVLEGSGAEKAGLKKGDVITKVNQDKIETAADLTKAIGTYQPDEEVTITFLREDKLRSAVVRLGKNSNSMIRSFEFKMPDMPGIRNFEFDPEIERNFRFDWKGRENEGGGNGSKPRLGIKAQDREDGKGVQVLEVNPSSAAEKAGIRPGDVIQRFDGTEVNSADRLAEVAAAAKNKETIKIDLLRSGKTQEVEVKIPRKLKTAQL